MVLNGRSILGGIAGTLAVFWLTLSAYEQSWQLEISEDQDFESSRIKRLIWSQLKSEETDQSRDMEITSFSKIQNSELLQAFQPVFTKEEKLQVMEAMRVLTEALDFAGIDYFLYAGSLIGSWRHHDVVPWDDDLDIFVNISSWESLERLNIPGHTMNVRTLNRYKFYNNNATDVPLRFWKWPFIDICFFGDNGTHLYDIDPAFSKTYVYDKQDIFPLTRRPFGNLNLKSPKNVLSVLQRTYNINDCQSRSYNHKREKALDPKKVSTVDCRLLHRMYPFVIRNNHFADFIENVYLDGKLLNSIDLHSINL